MSEITWKKQAFSIAFEVNSKREMREVEGTVAEGTGLGYYWTYETVGYNATIDVIGITHLASGRCIPTPIRSETETRLIIEKLCTMVDWTLPLEQLIKCPGYITVVTTFREIQASVRSEQEASC